MPSGNSVMIDVLYKIFDITGNISYKELADNTFSSSASSLNRSLDAHCNIIASIPEHNPRKTIFIKCDISKAKEIKERIFNNTRLQDQVFIIDKDLKTEIKNIDSKASKGEFTAYMCEGFVCSEPIVDFDELLAKMRS